MGFASFLTPNYTNSENLFDLISHEDWKLVVMHCKMNPKEASAWTLRKGFFDGAHDARVLPIHQACALCPPREAIDALAECHPQGLKSREDTFQRLPLHIACQTRAPPDTIRALVCRYPEAARIKDSLGRLPIHYACAHEVSLDVIDLLLRAFPASAGCGDMNGWLPIHVASRRGLPHYVVRLLLDAFPAAAEMSTCKGSTPIMCAMKGQSQNHQDIVGLLKEYIQNRSINPKKDTNSSGILLPMGIPTIKQRSIHAMGA